MHKLRVSKYSINWCIEFTLKRHTLTRQPGTNNKPRYFRLLTQPITLGPTPNMQVHHNLIETVIWFKQSWLLALNFSSSPSEWQCYSSFVYWLIINHQHNKYINQQNHHCPFIWQPKSAAQRDFIMQLTYIIYILNERGRRIPPCIIIPLCSCIKLE